MKQLDALQRRQVDGLDRACWPTSDRSAAVVSSVVLSADPLLQEAAVDYWDMSSALHREVVARARAAASAETRDALEALCRRPDDARAAGTLRHAVESLLDSGDPRWVAAADCALAADALGRLAAHVGDGHDADVEPVTVDDLVPEHTAASDRPVGAGRACIVVPFRDRTADRGRLRNLLACLRALDDQDVPRGDYRVVVVEADEEPRWAGVLEHAADDYVHVRSGGHFNKAWAVNVGVVQRGAGAELVCVLDADVLVDRGFVRRNVGRFRARGAQAHLPFRDALCLDAASSHRAARERVVLGRPGVPLDVLRGAVLRRPPGHCVWVRRGLFDRVGGFDERFEGWGGEDLDFVFRLDVVGSVDRYDDPLLHLYHERPLTQVDGRRFYAGRRLLSWSPQGPVGQLAGPATSSDDDLAGLIERVDETPEGS
ncbi:glycosyltransferase [Cellulomonas fimi]|uniref:glycosyltransferase n=1 Tax=Cellulomonas fimi TaxID=1708 RepID=UPI0023581D7F|nr:galactosyltransferase-related protein [Cellulomonas fimi]